MSKPAENRRLLAGKITTAHGVRGLVKVQVFAENAALLNGPLFTSETGGETLTLTLKNQLGGKTDNLWLASIDGITDRNAAELLRGRELWLPREKLGAPAAGEYYINDLIGLAVHDEAGNTIGTVRAIDNFGAGDLLDIVPPAGEAFYLAFTADNIVGVSLPDRIVTVKLPEEIE